MPGPDQRELPPFYPSFDPTKHVEELEKKLRERAESQRTVFFGVPDEKTPAPRSQQADFEKFRAKLDSIIERLRRIEAELCGVEIDHKKYITEKKGAIWTARSSDREE